MVHLVNPEDWDTRDDFVVFIVEVVLRECLPEVGVLHAWLEVLVGALDGPLAVVLELPKLLFVFFPVAPTWHFDQAHVVGLHLVEGVAGQRHPEGTRALGNHGGRTVKNC